MSKLPRRLAIGWRLPDWMARLRCLYGHHAWVGERAGSRYVTLCYWCSRLAPSPSEESGE